MSTHRRYAPIGGPGGLFINKIRIKDTDDVSLTSTEHGLQIGPNDGQNLRLDTNEITCVDNGVADTLNLNADGGTVQIGANTAGTLSAASGSTLRVYDASNTDYVQIADNGTNSQITTNNNALQFSAGGNLYQFLAATNGLRVYETANSDYVQISHDGTNGAIFANTGELILQGTGATDSAPTVQIGSTGHGTTDNVVLSIEGNADCSIVLVADADNVTEDHNPWIEFRQDGSAVIGGMGLTDTDKYPDGATLTGAGNNRLIIYNKFSSGGIEMWSNGNEGVTLDGSANIFFPSHRATAGAASTVQISSTTGELTRFTSSIRYKKNVKPITAKQKAGILDLQVVTYQDKNDDALRPEWSFYGLIAEEVAKIDPRLVEWIDDKDKGLIPEAVFYDKIGVVLLEIVKDQQKRIEELERTWTH